MGVTLFVCFKNCFKKANSSFQRYTYRAENILLFDDYNLVCVMSLAIDYFNVFILNILPSDFVFLSLLFDESFLL